MALGHSLPPEPPTVGMALGHSLHGTGPLTAWHWATPCGHGSIALHGLTDLRAEKAATREIDPQRWCCAVASLYTSAPWHSEQSSSTL